MVSFVGRYQIRWWFLNYLGQVGNNPSVEAVRAVLLVAEPAEPAEGRIPSAGPETDHPDSDKDYTSRRIYFWS